MLTNRLNWNPLSNQSYVNPSSTVTCLYCTSLAIERDPLKTWGRRVAIFSKEIIIDLIWNAKISLISFGMQKIPLYYLYGY